ISIIIFLSPSYDVDWSFFHVKFCMFFYATIYLLRNRLSSTYITHFGYPCRSDSRTIAILYYLLRTRLNWFRATIIKREGRKLHNFLTLVLGIFVLVWPIVLAFISVHEEQPFLFSFVFFLTTLVSYFYFLMVCFGIAALFNRFRNPFKSYHYIIVLDRKSTRLNSSHVSISYAVF